MATKKKTAKKGTTKKKSTSSKKSTNKKKEENIFPLSKPRGTQDILPEEQTYWEYVSETAKAVLRGWHFQQIETPVFEEVPLFERSAGEDSDVVSKEMFELKSRSKGTSYALRPEGTAPIARAYIEHGMRSWPRPVKLFYLGPFFRYDRPQKGRYRQFHQFGAEIFGSSSPITDAQLIYVAHLILQQLGIEDYVVKINSIGEAKERKEYIKVLKDYLRRNRQKLSRESRERITSNPLRILDSKDEKDQRIVATAPQLLDHLSDDSQNHFKEVVGMLEELEVPHEIAPNIVRGLDYYTHTVFEIVPKSGDEESQQNSLISGGRYDGLVKLLGGKDTPGIGWAAGIERIIDRMKDEGVELTLADKPQVFVAQLGDAARIEALRVMKMLREADIPFAESIHRDGMQAQLKAADRLQVGWTLIIGHKEVLDKSVILRNMESGMQEVVMQDQLVGELRKRLNVTIAG